MVSAYRVLIFLICVAFVFQPAQVSGLRNANLVPRQSKENQVPILRTRRTLKAVSVEDLNMEKKTAHVNKSIDPNQSSKRKVRRGSDPIHNRS